MEVVGGIPVECLTAGELAGIWSGWSTLGDREVVREASAKGTHLKLAYKCLAYRKSWTIDEAQKYFYTEAEIWIDELLRKRQIHRAHHILKNVGKDPLTYIRETCIECTDFNLREYLARYVVNNNGFTDAQIEAWQIVQYMKMYREKCRVKSKTIENISIDEILNLSQDVKDSLLTEIYFHIYEPCLTNKLKNNIVWHYLLLCEKIEVLIGWVDRQFGEDKRDIIVEGNNLSAVFDNLEITEEMMNAVKQFNAAVPIQETLLNHLVQYGLFTKKERQNVKLTLSRLMGASITPSKFESIISKKTCNLEADTFRWKIHSILYHQTVHTDDINRELYLKDKKLLDLFNNMHKTDGIDQKTFNHAICQTIHHVSDDIDTFLGDNPLITLYLVLSESMRASHSGVENDTSLERVSIKDMIDSTDGLVIGDITIKPKILAQLKNLPYLKDAIDPTPQREEITMYQLLHGFRDLDVHEFFKWRQKNDTMPNFTNESLIKKYGHKEKLTYEYYLKEARPNMAAYMILNAHGKIENNLSSKEKSRIALYAHIFGLKHVSDVEIINTCIIFIELLGVDSEFLRLHTTAANYVETQLKISINDLLESITYYQNPKDLTTIMNHLERSFCKEFPTTSMTDVSNFVSSLRSWHFILRFANIHNMMMPFGFLDYLAMNDLWFEFVLVAQMFEYPLEQVVRSVSQFQNKEIREHLLISLMNSKSTEANPSNSINRKLSPRDGKQSILSKMSAKSSTNHCPTSPSSLQGTEEVVESDLNPPQYFPLNQSSSAYDNDLWLIILKCHQSQDPPGALLKVSREVKSPILIVLAACYEPSSTPAFCYSWLVISTQDESLYDEYTDCMNEQVWPARTVSNLFRKLVSLKFVDTMSMGMQIFMPDNPLCNFFEFLVQFVRYHDLESCRKSLEGFTKSCSSLKRNKMIDWDDIETTYLINEYWLATVAVECILTALGTCLDSTCLQIKFLNIFIEHDFNNAMNLNSPDFAVLLKIVESLAATNIKIDFETIGYSTNECNVTKEIQKCIQKLIENEDFAGALELSNIANLPCSQIILDQYRSEFARNINTTNNIDVTFWKKCALDIEKYNVGFEDAAKFFIEHTERMASHKERYEILQLALRTLKPIATDQQTIDTVEMAMWKSCILAGPDVIEITNEPKTFRKLKTELLSGVSNLRVSCILNDETEKRAVEALIDRFIDDEDLETALRLSAIFNYRHNDSKIIMLCLSIAEGEISPYELSSHQKMLLLEPTKTKQQKLTLENRSQRRHSESSLNVMSLSSPVENIPVDNDEADKAIPTLTLQKVQTDCIDLLEKLVKNLQHGTHVGKKIALLYKLSAYLKKSYRSLLVSRDPMEILYEITGINIPGLNKFILINDGIVAYRIKDTEVAKFLVGEWLLHVTRQVEDGVLDDFIRAPGYLLNINLRVIAYVSADASLLGWELLKNAQLRLGHSYGAKRDFSTLRIIIELLILAHDYFTVSCNMEGIASVLRKSQNLANTLEHMKLWSSLVRLVTGIGRFTEMNYIFQILKENDQFEFLLGKGFDKNAGLKTALLEFCKKQCPEDKELFNLVVSHFQLYNEIAIMWESEAKTVIRELIKETRRDNMKLISIQSTIKFTKNDKTEKKLQLAMDNFTHATEFCLKDSKLNLANRCSCQAQLVALQLSLFSGVNQNHEVMSLLNLTTEEINRAICQSLTFPQTLILIQAYNHNVDWSNVLYHQVIINDDARYLKDFLAYKRLTPAIVQDCACRYRLEKNITKQMTMNMQSLISELNDIECKYVLASQLGFKNIIEVMISNATTGAYLRDTIWKQGFHPQEFIGENFRG